MSADRPSVPLILVTNDDGIHATGLRAAAEALVQLGDVLIVAPASQQTGMGRAFPRTGKEGVINCVPGPLADGTTLYHAVTGSPAQAVAHAVTEIASRRPALCVCGVNNGENVGATNLISGTVGAALEAAAFGIPAMAVSIGPEDGRLYRQSYDERDWMIPAGIIGNVAAAILVAGLPDGVSVLNINIPREATLDTEMRLTAQSAQNCYMCSAPSPRDFSKPCRLPIIETTNLATLEPGSDAHAFYVDSVISVTPMGCDLTVRDSIGGPTQCLDLPASGGQRRRTIDRDAT